jgi:hypothetical protein
MHPPTVGLASEFSPQRVCSGQTPSAVARVFQYCRFHYFTHDSPDGHNGKQGLSRFSNPGRFGYSTFLYPVQYSYKRGLHTSLLQPYQYLLDFILPFYNKQDSILVVTLKAGDGVSSNHDIFSPELQPLEPRSRRDFADLAKVGSSPVRGYLKHAYTAFRRWA